MDNAHLAACFVLDSYVADELITSRAGVRVRVGNTDAEGRMAMADVLCHMKERVRKIRQLSSWLCGFYQLGCGS